MNTFISIVLLQFSLFGSSGEAVKGAKVSIDETSSGKTVAYVELGYSGDFLFSNLDPGNYFINIEIPENTVKKIDKKSKQKYDTDIEVAFNKKQESYCWQREDGYVLIELSNQKKVAESYVPLFEKYEINKAVEVADLGEENTGIFNDIPKTGEEPEFEPEKEKRLFKKKEVKKINQEPSKFKVLQFTVIKNFGTIGGSVNSVSQKDFHKLTVGTKDETLEDLGEVEVVKKIK